MILIKGAKYRLVFEVSPSKVLTYIATIVEDEESFVTFVDINNTKLSFNKSKLIRVEELDG